MRVTPDDPQSDWVGDEGEHDRGFQAGPLEREDGRGRDGDDHVGLLRREPRDERVEPIGVPLPAQEFDRGRAAVVVAKLLQRLEEQMDRRSLRVSAVQDGDPRRSSARAALITDAASSPAMNTRRLIRSPRWRGVHVVGTTHATSDITQNAHVDPAIEIRSSVSLPPLLPLPPPSLPSPPPPPPSPPSPSPPPLSPSPSSLPSPPPPLGIADATPPIQNALSIKGEKRVPGTSTSTLTDSSSTLARPACEIHPLHSRG